MSNKELPIKIRQATQDDVSFLFNSWLRSFRDNGVARPVANEIYFAEQHKLIETLFKRCKTVVATDPNDPASIYGWACFERIEGLLVTHYVYVKHPFRMLGIAKELLKEAEHDFNNASLYTHWTTASMKLAPKHNMLYHPYILMNYQNPKAEANRLPSKEE
jgi:hypothetical protein